MWATQMQQMEREDKMKQLLVGNSKEIELLHNCQGNSTTIHMISTGLVFGVETVHAFSYLFFIMLNILSAYDISSDVLSHVVPSCKRCFDPTAFFDKCQRTCSSAQKYDRY